MAGGTKLIANFYRLGVRLTLSGEGAGSSGAYQSGDLAGKSVVVEEGQSRHFQIAPGNEEEEQLSFELPDLNLRAPPDTEKAIETARIHMGRPRSAPRGARHLQL